MAPRDNDPATVPDPTSGPALTCAATIYRARTHRRRLGPYTNLTGRLSASQVLRTYKQQWLVERRHRDLKSSLKVRPIFLQNGDRIAALISVIGLALLVFGLIESELRRRLGEGLELPGLLGESRSARPTGRAVIAAFQGLGLTYTANGIELDRLTPTQRLILDLLDVSVPWPEHAEPALSKCGGWS